MGALAGAVPVTAWAFALDRPDHGRPADRGAGGRRPRARRAAAAHVRDAARRRPRRGLPRRGEPAVRRAPSGSPGRGLLALLAVVPVAAAIALASAPGGIDGQLTTAWKQLTDPASGTPNNTPDRLTTTSSVRARYWEEAFDIHATTPWVGAGAGAYATARTRFRTGTLAVRHAHGYVPQTLADLGWAGMALSLLALGAVGVDRRARDRPAPARPRPAVGRRARRPRHARRGRRSSSASPRRSTGPGSCRPTRPRRCSRRAGWRGAARCARACAPRRRRR